MLIAIVHKLKDQVLVEQVDHAVHHSVVSQTHQPVFLLIYKLGQAWVEL